MGKNVEDRAEDSERETTRKAILTFQMANVTKCYICVNNRRKGSYINVS